MRSTSLDVVRQPDALAGPVEVVPDDLEVGDRARPAARCGAGSAAGRAASATERLPFFMSGSFKLPSAGESPTVFPCIGVDCSLLADRQRVATTCSGSNLICAWVNRSVVETGRCVVWSRHDLRLLRWGAVVAEAVGLDHQAEIGQ